MRHLTNLALLVTLAGCTTNDGASALPGDPHSAWSAPAADAPKADALKHDAADTMFAQTMIPHHQQAVEMSQMILDKKDIEPSVAALAARIKDAQAPEITTMKGWLEAWSEPLDHNLSGNHLAGPHSMMKGHGMMGADDLAALEAAAGHEACRLYLTQMISHHEGAVEMARTESEKGTNPDAMAMAMHVITSQESEIAEMKALLATIPAT